MRLRNVGAAGMRAALSTASVPPAPPMKKLRILALHGYGQRGQSFRKKSGSLRKAAKACVSEFIFLDAPHKAPLRVGATPATDADADGGLAWWLWDSDEAQQTATGWQESVEYIRQALHENGPIDGILGFSQGASMGALLLPALSDENEAGRSVTFACLASGFLPRSAEQAAAAHRCSESVQVWTSYGTSDKIIPADLSVGLHEALVGADGDAGIVGDSTIIAHKGGHLVSSEKETRASFKAFLVAQQRRQQFMLHVGAGHGVC